MFSEHECGICYQTYNTGRRCPRELHCRHSFCERCLQALSRPLGAADEASRLEADTLIVCPLCRHTTSISGEGKVRAELRVDETVLERLIVSGVLDEDEEEEEDDLEGDAPDACDDTGELPEIPAEESDVSPDSRGGKVRRTCRKVWRLIIGKSSRQRGGENCMTNDDLRDFAMMAFYM